MSLPRPIESPAILCKEAGTLDDAADWQEYFVARIFFQRQMEKLTNEKSSETR
jgi:type II secretory pathway component PulJ